MSILTAQATQDRLDMIDEYLYNRRVNSNNCVRIVRRTDGDVDVVDAKTNILLYTLYVAKSRVIVDTYC